MQPSVEPVAVDDFKSSHSGVNLYRNPTFVRYVKSTVFLKNIDATSKHVKMRFYI